MDSQITKAIRDRDLQRAQIGLNAAQVDAQSAPIHRASITQQAADAQTVYQKQIALLTLEANDHLLKGKDLQAARDAAKDTRDKSLAGISQTGLSQLQEKYTLAQMQGTSAAIYSVTAACDEAGISRETAYTWRGQDERFARLWDVALLRCKDALGEATFASALAGSTLERFFLLKKMDPSYKDSYIPPQPQPERRTLRFLTDEERDAAIEADYRSVPQLAAASTTE